MSRNTRSKQNTQQRATSGKFKRKCGAMFHEDDSENSTFINLKKGKKIKKKVYESMLNRGIITSTVNHICSKCYTLCSNVEKTNTNCEYESKEEYRNDSEDENEEVERSLDEQIVDDTKEMFKRGNTQSTSLDCLLNYDAKEWLEQRPNNLVEFLLKVTKLDYTSSEKDLQVVSKIIELIYKCRNSKLILPISFQENVLLYSLTNCKTLVNHSGSSSPSGSYYYLTKWMNDLATEPVQFPSGIARAIFDNNQKIGRTYVITGDNKVPSSVMTSNLWLSLNPLSDLQNNHLLAPSEWMWKEKEDEVFESLLASFSNTHQDFRETRDTFIEACLNIVRLQHKNNSDCIDSYIKSIDSMASEKICQSCGCECDISHRYCRNCGGSSLEKHKFEDWEANAKVNAQLHPYTAFEKSQVNAPTVQSVPGEPYFVNPNSYETITEVLKNIGTQAGIKKYGGNTRQWLFVECDGLPYNILRDIIKNLYHCNSCKDSFYQLESFHEHKCYILNEVEPTREFDWLVPITGLLHFEMNAARSFVSMNWNVFTSAFGYDLGFKSIKAQEYLKKGSDHHKLWHFIEILYVSIALELLTPYVRQCAEKNEIPNANSYWLWSDDAKNSNYIYMQQMAFTFLHALIMLRAGVRKCNATLVNCAKSKLAFMMFSRNHPTYQNIIYLDALDNILMPEELRMVKEQFISVSRTGRVGHYQGGDALLEEVNKDSKSWLKLTGVPSNMQWQRVFRNLDNLNKIKQKNIGESLGSSSGPNHYFYSSSQVNKVRTSLRRNCYFDNVEKDQPHTSVDGEIPLNEELVNFTWEAKDRLEKIVRGKFYNLEVKSKSICTTAAEFEEQNLIDNLTKSEIIVKIYKSLESMDTSRANSEEEVFKKTIKNKSKREYIQFYYKLINMLNEPTVTEEDDEEEEEE